MFLYLCDTDVKNLNGNQYARLMSERLNKFGVAMCAVSCHDEMSCQNTMQLDGGESMICQ